MTVDEEIESNICGMLVAGADLKDFSLRSYTFDVFRTDLMYMGHTVSIHTRDYPIVGFARC